MKPDCILFDLDGTLLDTHDLILDSMRYATREVLGCTVPDDELMAKVGTPLHSQMVEISTAHGMPERADELTSVYRAYNEAIHDEWVRTFDGIHELLTTLQATGIRMGVVTSKRHELALQGLRVCGIDGFFELMVGPDDWPDAKPHPGGIIRAMELLGVAPEQTWYVGDSPFDIQAGNSAGCFTVAALWGMFPRDVLAAQNPAELCEAPADMQALLSC